jgi:hypothetical protein
MEIRRGIIASRMDIDCCGAVTSIVEAVDFANRSFFSRDREAEKLTWLLYFFK